MERWKPESFRTQEELFAAYRLWTGDPKTGWVRKENGGKHGLLSRLKERERSGNEPKRNWRRRRRGRGGGQQATQVLQPWSRNIDTEFKCHLETKGRVSCAKVSSGTGSAIHLGIMPNPVHYMQNVCSAQRSPCSRYASCMRSN